MTRRRRKARPPSQGEVLEDVRDVLLHLLACSACEHCHGLGRMNDAEPGKPAEWRRCACRLAAQGLLSDFGLAEDPGPLPGEESEDSEDP